MLRLQRENALNVRLPKAELPKVAKQRHLATKQSLLKNIQKEIQNKINYQLLYSVSDPYHFDSDLDPR